MNAAYSKYSSGGKELWQYRGRNPDGTQFRKIGFRTKAEAQDDYQQREKLLIVHGYIPPHQITVGEWFTHWLEVVDETLRVTTASSYRDVVERHIYPYLGGIKLQKLDESDIRNMYRSLAEKGLSDNTLLNVQRRLRKGLNDAVIETKMVRNPARNVKLPKGIPPRVRNTWTFEQLQQFSEMVAEERDSALWAFWVTTGPRRGEICGLKWPVVDLLKGLATINWQRTVTTRGEIVEGPVKSKYGERIVPISPRVAGSLRNWKSAQSAIRLTQGRDWRGGDYVFTSYRHEPYNPGSFGERLSYLAEMAGLPRLTPHELRHTFGTRAIEDGMDVKLLSIMLGHSKIEVTLNLYVHPNNAQIKSAGDQLANRMFG